MGSILQGQRGVALEDNLLQRIIDSRRIFYRYHRALGNLNNLVDVCSWNAEGIPAIPILPLTPRNVAHLPLPHRRRQRGPGEAQGENYPQRRHTQKPPAQNHPLILLKDSQKISSYHYCTAIITNPSP